MVQREGRSMGVYTNGRKGYGVWCGREGYEVWCGGGVCDKGVALSRVGVEEQHLQEYLDKCTQ